ncbi:MAG TPA: DUF1634 domain-containing protein [Candidatus Limnocylindrales bacterium]|nr:DUF1634 domain-containing protein [Candidatus Limnocylindrales bacterium]
MNAPMDAGKNRNEPVVGNVAENVYADVYRVLLAGMIASTFFFILGIIVALLHPRYVPLSAAWIQQQYHWSVLAHGLATFDPTTLMMLATVLLILTPVVRVLVCVYVFYIDHDPKYVVVTSIVFLVMVLAVILSLFGLK